MAKKDRARKPTRKLAQEKRFLVVVEGAVTEPEYIEAIKRSRRMKSIQVLIETGHTDPTGIVNQAKAMRREASRTDSFDQVWCVFDTEAKQTQRCREGLLEAIDSAENARGGSIHLAISNPCFELWIWLHEHEQTAWIASTDIQTRCTRIVGKHIDNVDELLNYYPDAKRRAKQLDYRHERDNTKPEDRNPSSGVYKLIDAINAAFPPRIVTFP
jgi:hypothetical protein